MNQEQFESEQTTRVSTIIDLISNSEQPDVEGIKSKLTELVTFSNDYGKTNYNKKASQIKKLFEDAGFDDNAGIGWKEHIESLKKSKEVSNSKDDDIKVMAERLRKLEEERDAERKSKEELRVANEKNIITNKLSEALGSKIRGSKLVIKDLINEGRVKIVDNEVVGVNGDNFMLFDDFIDSISKEYSDLLINTQVAGTQSSKPSATIGKKQFTREDVSKMSSAEVRANWKDIQHLYQSTMK